MGCMIEFVDSLLRFEFCGEGSKQEIMIDVLLKHSGMNLKELAGILGVPVIQIRAIKSGKDYLMGSQADDLAQLFLLFLGHTFFRKYTLIRNFVEVKN